MRISMIAVPIPSTLVTERIHDKFDASRSIGDKNNIKLGWIGVEQSQQPQPDVLYAARG